MYRKIDIQIPDEYLYRDSSTSDGSQKKYYYENRWYKIDKLGGEAEAEALSSMLLEHSNLSPSAYVHYDICTINGEPGCVSDDFISDHSSTEFITFYRLYKNITGRDLSSITSKMDYDDAIEYVIDFVKKVTSLDIREYLANIFYLDEIILNSDRHFNNYGVIFRNEKYELAPIFDNGKSLLVGYQYDAKQPLSDATKKVCSKSFSPSFKINCKYLADARTLVIDTVSLLQDLDQYPVSTQASVLLHQISLQVT